MKKALAFFKELLSAIISISTYKLAKLPLISSLIKSTADITEDKRKDRHDRREPKDFLSFKTEDEFLTAFHNVSKPLYRGTKSEVIRLVKQDQAGVLKPLQAKKLLKQIREHEHGWFIVIHHPLTKH